MLNSREKRFIEENAYIPEHIFTYVCSVSDVKAYFSEPFLYYSGEDMPLIYIGYALKKRFDGSRFKRSLREAIDKTGCENINIILPEYPVSGIDYSLVSIDAYYRIELSSLQITSKVRNMINRATRILNVEKTRQFSKDHKELIEQFLKEKMLGEDHAKIIRNIPLYIDRSDTVLLLDARDNNGRLVAFDVVDIFSKGYIFYMFNITSRYRNIHGVSDLLMSEIIKMAIDTEKQYINLGLGINEGVRFFKEKWGARPFLPYYMLKGDTTETEKVLSIIDRLL